MARLRYNGLTAELGSSLTSGATSVSFAAALTHSGGVAVPTLSSPDYVPLSLLDSTGGVAEVAYLTAYTAGATTGTIVRGREGTAGGAHAAGVTVLHAPTTWDVPVAVYKTADETVTNSAVAQADDHLAVPIAGGQTLHVVFELFVSSSGANGDFRANVSVPTGATVRWTSIVGPVIATPASEGDLKNQGYPGAVDLSAGVPLNTNADAMIRYTATVENGSTAGVVTLRWAQNVAAANGTTVKAGSVAIGYPVS